jgi:hypothetical protein
VFVNPTLIGEILFAATFTFNRHTVSVVESQWLPSPRPSFPPPAGGRPGKKQSIAAQHYD